MSKFIVLFLISAVLALLLTPLCKILARRIGAIDMPEARKVHKAPKPRLGGLAIASSFLITLLVAIFIPGSSKYVLEFLGPNTGLLLLAFLFIMGIGIYDDVRNAKPALKFSFQFAAGFLVYLAGVQIKVIFIPFGGASLNLGWLSLPVTLLWVVGVTNAFNLIDGLDGLASGVVIKKFQMSVASI